MDRKLGPQDLRRAISNQEIVVYYQPQVASATGQLMGVESLIRWLHPEYGFLSPGEFLPQVQDDAHIIQLLSETVLRLACEEASAWPNLTLGLNVSPLQFRLEGFAGRLTEIATSTGFPLDRLEIEILESAYFDNPARMRDILTDLRNKGIKIALDDFGTGYSSLAVLMELPLDKLKIDAGFVRKFEDVRSASIIHAIVALARAIGLKITAEGVETEKQRSFLRAAGCHYLQGYLFSPPVPAGKITAMLKAS